MTITFTKNSKTTGSLNRLLETVLPGHTTNTALKPTSSSQIINSTQKKLKPEFVRRQRKKEKLEQRKNVKLERLSREQVEAQARYDVLLQHSKHGTLTTDEKKELKRLIKKNVVNVQSWRMENEEELKEIQQDIMELQKTEYTRVKRRPTTKRLDATQLYNKKQAKRFPGLTPGLAPVDMEDSDEED
ncbi:CYFA0S19e00694g1_1 [Cyberlindnera fabianii]|uniref:Regulator of rDNA transcription 14 n=1 Tax=Cyberlindnera fabianii TaxID=36022 RepID=A0A061BF53_CYBFA|nr:CYFA0S19e00694g1_1 [Cyberlindnera fabianii]